MMPGAEATFVLPGADDAELDRIRRMDVDRDWRFFSQGTRSWIVQTFLILLRSGEPVRLDNVFSPSAVNFAHVTHLVGRRRPAGCYVVGIQADYPPVGWCDFHIVQNKSQVTRKTAWVPHWPQPGLIARDAGRGPRLERVGYFGLDVNHYTKVFHKPSGFFRVREEIRKITDKLELQLVERGPDAWNDFSDVDVAIGLRAFGRKRFDTKPPTKLINAWLAEVPFIGGGDSAFTQVGCPGHDFLQAVRPSDIEHHLVTLARDAEVRDQIVRAGSETARMYNRESIRDAWVGLISSLSGE